MRQSDNLDLISLEAACALVPTAKGQKKPHIQTVRRWAKRGIQGLKLKSVMACGRRCTTAEWIAEFLDSIQDPSDVTVSSRSKKSLDSVLRPKRKSRKVNA